jgi:hypothetical protein
MKNILILIVLITSLISCTKQPITPGNYHAGQPAPVDTTQWQNGYANGGTVPTSTVTTANNINGTNWVLTDVYSNYAHVAKSDTIHFISNTRYKVNSDTTKYVYNLYETMGNSTIELNTFNPINGLNLTANNFNSNAFATTPVGGTIQLLLKDIFNTSTTYTSTFKKI